MVEPVLMRAAGRLRRNWIIGHLAALDAQLAELGGRLVVRWGPAATAVPQVVAESRATALYGNADVTPFSAIRDRQVTRAVSVPVRWFGGLTVHEPGAVLTSSGRLSRVFTPFYRRWSSTPLTPWPLPGGGRPMSLPSEALPELDRELSDTPGESGAHARLSEFLQRVDDYADTRDLLAEVGTSGLSVDLKFGSLAARTALEAIGSATPGREAFVRQLCWRDWWAHTLSAHPDLPDVAVNHRFRGIRWRDDRDHFERWRTGRTGYPIVDAGMRQLVQTGWMHNRVRMVCASFLVKDLLIDWRLGERFFRHHLSDADVAQNVGNWQWVAGLGPDAAPYFRVFNPVRQALRCDPEGDYVRRWVPELRGLAGSSVHEPWTVDPELLSVAGVVLGSSYPEPIVDHAEARRRALETYKRAAS